MKKGTWTDEQLNILVHNWHRVGNSKIAKMVGKNESSVRQKAERYITMDMMRCRKWCEFEDKLLLELYGTMTMKELSERMKRSERSLTERMRRLEGSQDVAIIQDIYSCQDVALFLGVHRNTVTNMYKNGRIPMVKFSNRRIVIDSEKFWGWLKENLDVPNYLNITDSTQLVSPEWYQELIKEKKQKNKDDKSYKKWTSKEDAILWAEIMRYTTHKEIADKLNRSVVAVSARVVRLSKKKMRSVN